MKSENNEPNYELGYLKMIYIPNDEIQILLILFLISTQQNIHGCCDGYKWDSVDNDCVSMFLFSINEYDIYIYSFL